jgi:hypothetical protein
MMVRTKFFAFGKKPLKKKTHATMDSIQFLVKGIVN